jgi:hypothetical protein
MNRSWGRNILRTAGLVALVLAGPAAAHHSYAMFNREKVVTLSGTVSIWEYNNPHSSLWIYVKNADGRSVLYGVEGPGPGILARQGLTRASIKPGDQITVKVNPLRDGRPGGNLVQVTTAGGRVLTVGALPK